MQVTSKYIASVLETLPIGYYFGKGITLELSDTAPTSAANPITNSIVIASRNIFLALGGENVEGTPEEVEEYVRDILYHELSHLILTGDWSRVCSVTPQLNIFEDERIETLLAKYYHGTNFKRFVFKLNGWTPDRKPRDEKEYFFHIVRFRQGPADLVEKVTKLILKWKDLTAVGNDSYSWRSIRQDYRDDVDRFYAECCARFAAEKEAEAQNQNGGSGDSSENQSSENKQQSGGDSSETQNEDDAGNAGDAGNTGDNQDDSTETDGGKGGDKNTDDAGDEKEANAENGQADDSKTPENKGEDQADGDESQDGDSQEGDSQEGENQEGDSQNAGSESSDGEGDEQDGEAPESEGDGSAASENGDSGDSKQNSQGDSDDEDADDSDATKSSAGDGGSNAQMNNAADAAEEEAVRSLSHSIDLPDRDDIAKIVNDIFKETVDAKQISDIQTRMKRMITRANNRRAFQSPFKNGFTGKINPRLVAFNHDYKWLTQKNVDGNHHEGSKIHITFWVDNSGSFSSSEKQLNSLMAAMYAFERSNFKEFSYDVVTMNDHNVEHDKSKAIKCNCGNRFGPDIKRLASKFNRPMNQNYNVVVWDGDLASDNKNWRETWEAYAKKHADAFGVFDNKHTVIIADDGNEKVITLGCPNAKKMFISGNYASQFIEETLKLLEKIMGC